MILAVGVLAATSAVAVSIVLTRSGRLRVAAAGGLVAVAIVGQLYGPDHPSFTGLMVVLLGAGAGNLLGLLLRERPTLISFAITAALVDLYSVWRGPTRALIERARDEPELMSWLAVQLPTADRVVGVIGAGDLLIAATLAAGMLQTGLGPKVAASATVAALAVAMLCGLLLGPLPGIPFLAAATVMIALRRQER